MGTATPTDPEDERLLATLNPARRYTRAEVEQIMELLSGMVNDGLPIKAWRLTQDTRRYYAVEVAYDNYVDAFGGDYETWYFYKP
jgi:hypothetical protein